MKTHTHQQAHTMEPPNNNVVQVTRNKKNPQQDNIPAMADVIQKLELLSSTEEEMPDTLKMTMDGQDGQEPIEAHCEAVSQNDGSVQYECRIIQTTPSTEQKTKESTTMPRVTGKFSLNLP